MTDCQVTAGREDEGLHSSDDLDPILKCKVSREGNQVAVNANKGKNL